MKLPKEFIRFCIVGGICTLLDWAIFSLTVSLLHYRAAALLGFALSFIANYWLSAHYTFRKKPTKRNFLGMTAAHLFNVFVVRLGLLTLFIEVLSLTERVAYLPTLCISAVSSFLLVRLAFHKLDPEANKK